MLVNLYLTSFCCVYSSVADRTLIIISQNDARRGSGRKECHKALWERASAQRFEYDDFQGYHVRNLRIYNNSLLNNNLSVNKLLLYNNLLITIHIHKGEEGIIATVGITTIPIISVIKIHSRILTIVHGIIQL